MGASQVLPYLEGVAREGMAVTLHSFEKSPPTAELKDRLAAASVEWRPHRFGAAGGAGGAWRAARGARVVRGADLVHARSDLPAASALLARGRCWVWDVRSFWADERISLGTLTRDSLQERVLRRVEAAAAQRASAVITLTEAAIDVLARRHGEAIRDRATVIPTCVDTARFALHPLPEADAVRVMLSGSFNALYDLETSLRLISTIGKRRKIEVTLVRPRPSAWDEAVLSIGGRVASANFSEMPTWLAASHVGLCVLRLGAADTLAACAPTKIAEFLATGRPVVVNAGIGDFDRLLTRYGCGVIIAEPTAAGLGGAADELCALLDDPGTPARCRALAVERFDLSDGVRRLSEVYRRALGGAGR
ncbi:MAG TPA: glycosyltransferase [Acidimicrobiales bacterium]|nr:glycosyltransferase [Acidimicrobiales bacterium]